MPTAAPADSATVDFKVFNYLGFATIATKITGNDGRTSIELGSDVLVWATQNTVDSDMKSSPVAE